VVGDSHSKAVSRLSAAGSGLQAQDSGPKANGQIGAE